MQKYILGVDIGTTSTKAGLFSLNGEMFGFAQQGYPLFQDLNGMAEQDSEQIYAAVLQVIAELSAQVSPEQIIALSFSSAMHSLIVLDQHQQSLTRCITWADNRAAAAGQWLAAQPEAEELYQRTGVPNHPMTPLAKIIWLRQEQPKLFAQAAYFISIKEYIFLQLFGELIVDYSIAASSGMLNLAQLAWEQSALNLAGISSKQLSQVVVTTHQLTGLAENLRLKLGLSAACRFIVGSSDGCLANLGIGALDEQSVALTIGTSGALRRASKTAYLDSAARTFCYPLLADLWIIGGPVNSGGIVLQWFYEQIYAPQTSATLGNDYAPMLTAAAQINAGSDGLFFLPYLAGERAPLWDANARGSFFGLSHQHTKEHMARAVLEGISFNLRAVLELLEIAPATSLNKIIASGGFAHSSLWCQILADIFNCEIIIPESVESSCWGAALLGFYACGMLADISTSKNLLKIGQCYTPNLANVKRYAQSYQLFSELNQQLKSLYSKLAQTQIINMDKEQICQS